jgi:hypothetical protein
MPLPNRDMSDWDWVKKQAEADSPIPYDPEDGPYDPNDEAATEAFLTEAEILTGWPEQRLVKEAGVPVDEWQESESRKSEVTRKKKAS